MPELPQSTVADANGEATITVQPRDSAGWTVTQVSVEMRPGAGQTDNDVSGSASCAVRKNGFLVSPAVAQGDAVAGDPTVQLQPGDVLTVEWTACNPGNVCQALVFYERGI